MKIHRFLIGLLLPAVLALAGCQHTKEAYQAAETPDEYAYVMAEHYSSLLKEAADLAEKATTPRSAVQAMQRAELKATPAVKRLKELRDSYLAIRSADNEAALQAAIDKAVLLVADMVRAVRSARSPDSSRNWDIEERQILAQANLLMEAT